MDKLDWFKANAERFSGQLFWDEPLARHTYYRIGGPARLLAVPVGIEALQWLAEGMSKTGVRVFILGAGSNILVSDTGFDGLVIKCTRMNSEISRGAKNFIRTGAGVAVSSLLRRASEEGWGGLEFLAGIPGSVGGVIAMNAGTHLGEAKDRLQRVEAFNLMDKTPGLVFYEASEFKFEYRNNLFLPRGAVVWASEWEVDSVEPNEVRAKIAEILARRKSTQPVDLPSCGSVFKNPKYFSAEAMQAWQVIERLGLRGYRIGNAQFSDKHCNFIVNLGDASAADVRSLIELAKKRALNELGISLEEEVKYLGF